MKISSKIKYFLVLGTFFIICISSYLYYTKYRVSDLKSTTDYSYNVYTDKEAILSSSKLIVRGTVIDSKTKNINIAPEDMEPMVIEYKVASILITDVVKGNAKIGNTIEVKYPNDDAEEISNTLDNLISIDSDCLLFLNTYEEFGSNIPCSIVNPMQGVIKLNMYEDVDSSNDDSLDLFSDIPNEKIIDYLKDNM